MVMSIRASQIQFYDIYNIDMLPQLRRLSSEERFAMKVVANVLPFRANTYVVEELIDWENIPDDPIYQLTFVQKGMLRPEHYERMAREVRRGASRQEREVVGNAIRAQLNPHPSGQMTDNVPILDEEPVPGVQHKYQQTCLLVPS